MVTSAMCGSFQANDSTRQEFLNLIGGRSHLNLF
jgi:GTP cyclohydrolase I